MKTHQMMEKMGSEATEAEANALIALMDKLQLDPETVSDEQFFSLIATAVENSNNTNLSIDNPNHIA